MREASTQSNTADQFLPQCELTGFEATKAALTKDKTLPVDTHQQAWNAPDDPTRSTTARLEANSAKLQEELKGSAPQHVHGFLDDVLQVGGAVANYLGDKADDAAKWAAANPGKTALGVTGVVGGILAAPAIAGALGATEIGAASLAVGNVALKVGAATLGLSSVLKGTDGLINQGHLKELLRINKDDPKNEKALKAAGDKVGAEISDIAVGIALIGSIGLPASEKLVRNPELSVSTKELAESSQSQNAPLSLADTSASSNLPADDYDALEKIGGNEASNFAFGDRLAEIKSDPQRLAKLRANLDDPSLVNSAALDKALRVIYFDKPDELAELRVQIGDPIKTGEEGGYRNAISILSKHPDNRLRAELTRRGFPLPAAAVDESSPLDGLVLRATQQQFENSATLAERSGGMIQQDTMSRPYISSGPSADFRKVFQDKQGMVHYLLGDWEGHALAGAEQSVKLHKAFEEDNMAAQLTGKTASEGLAEIDKLVSSNAKTLSMTHVTLNPLTGEFDYASTGNNFAYLVHPNGELIPLDYSAPPMGGDLFKYGEMMEPEHFKTMLPENSVVAIMTDGITDHFDKDALGAMLSEAAKNGLSPSEISSQIAPKETQFEDDATMFILRWLGPNKN